MTPTIVIRTDAECMLRAAMGAVCIEHHHNFKNPHVIFREPLCNAGAASGHFEAEVTMLLFLLNWTLNDLAAGGLDPKAFKLRIVTGSKSLIQKLQATDTAATRVSGLLRECREAVKRFTEVSYA